MRTAINERGSASEIARGITTGSETGTGIAIIGIGIGIDIGTTIGTGTDIATLTGTIDDEGAFAFFSSSTTFETNINHAVFLKSLYSS